jgi:hypothetical protein
MCKVEAQTHHSIGGGGPGQAPINNISEALLCYDTNDKLIFSDLKAEVADNGGTATVSKAECRTEKDVTVSTNFDSASKTYKKCTSPYNSVRTAGTTSDKISSGTVSVTTSKYTI